MTFIQFYPWWDCNNNCAFCFAKLLKQHKTTKEEKIKALDEILTYLTNVEYMKDFEVVGLIGGEFFEDQLSDVDVYNKFLAVINQCITLIHNKVIDKLYLMTHLIVPDMTKLKEIIQKFNDEGLINDLLICTSFDAWGRFHTPERLQLWKDNVRSLQQLHVNIHAEIILTQYLIDKVLNQEIDLQYFIDNHIYIDFLNPQGLVLDGTMASEGKDTASQRFGSGWLPTRSSFLRFLSYLHANNLYDIRKLFTLDKRAQELHMFYPERKIQKRDIETYNEDLSANEVLPCGHSDKFSFYSDSDKCMVCDIKNFIEDFC